MRNELLLSLCMLLSLSVSPQYTDTTIRKVYVGVYYSPEIFPLDWRQAPINAVGHSMDPEEIPRCKAIMARALNKYPPSLLGRNLLAVYFLKDMKFYDVGYGGTNYTDAVYVTDQGVRRGYTDKYLEQTFHHEFSSILLRNYATYLDTVEWKSANDPDFDYNDPENGVGAIRNNQSSQALDSILCKEGILTQYATSGIENDVNTFAQNLFCPERNFWKYVEHYPRIRKKATLLINFYHRLNPGYTESLFRKMDSQFTIHADTKQKGWH